MEKPNEKDYFEYRGKFRIGDFGSFENYIDALEEYIDHLEADLKEERTKVKKQNVTILKHLVKNGELEAENKELREKMKFNRKSNPSANYNANSRGISPTINDDK